MIKPFPKPFQNYKPERLLRRDAVTVVAGFRCNKGVVLCADTQETIGVSKRHVPKLRFEQIDGAGAMTGSDLGVAFCGATDNGAFVDKIVDSAWSSAKNQSDIDNVCASIEKSIEDTYRHFGGIYQSGFMPYAELIYGVKMGGESRLFNALGPVVNKKEDYCTGGVGAYLADFLSARMYAPCLTTQQCVILAAYILFQTKEHVDGCGGESHIAILREDAASGLVELKRVAAITENLHRADLQLGNLLLTSSDIDLSDSEFKNDAATVIQVLEIFRDDQRKDFDKWDKLRRSFDRRYGMTLRRDSFGLPSFFTVGEDDE